MGCTSEVLLKYVSDCREARSDDSYQDNDVQRFFWRKVRSIQIVSIPDEKIAKKAMANAITTNDMKAGKSWTHQDCT